MTSIHTDATLREHTDRFLARIHGRDDTKTALAEAVVLLERVARVLHVEGSTAVDMGPHPDGF